MNWLADLASGKRTVYGILIAIILLTIPCYCLGFAALAFKPDAQQQRPTATPPPAIPTPLVEPSATNVPVGTIGPTPTGWVPPTLTHTPVASKTATAAAPTA